MQIVVKKLAPGVYRIVAQEACLRECIIPMNNGYIIRGVSSPEFSYDQPRIFLRGSSPAHDNRNILIEEKSHCQIFEDAIKRLKNHKRRHGGMKDCMWTNFGEKAMPVYDDEYFE